MSIKQKLYESSFARHKCLQTDPHIGVTARVPVDIQGREDNSTFHKFTTVSEEYYASILSIREAAQSSEMSVNIYQTILCLIPDVL
jgi:hypothetical protein